MFNIDEVFEMAEQIERNGVVFYNKAAEMFPEYTKKSVFLKLAEMEKEHEKRFHQMRLELAAKEREITQFLDPQGEAAAYLRAMVSGKVFDSKLDPTTRFKQVGSVSDVIRIAIDVEKDSIIFYLGLKEMIPQGLGKDKIDLIVREEMSHVALLSDMLEKIS
ncbi:rubrerythrin [Thermotoga sp. Ku-13t]|uniref:ferritin family protein n=1 Tax=Thermotoga sp. Ku-13t TaxID=1755813 RepID=UPI0013EAD10B|nr:ferritin family protein [Thermotoga sp. Ku-13t]KAF2958380.1 rubrerythrin [Thermotoga sp. Ku-13t]